MGKKEKRVCERKRRESEIPLLSFHNILLTLKGSQIRISESEREREERESSKRMKCVGERERREPEIPLLSFH